MEKQSASVYYPKIAAQPSLGLFGILREAYKISIRNGRPLLFILFILFSSQAVIRLGNLYILLPIAKDFVARSKLLPKDGTMFDSDPVLLQAFLKDMRHMFAYLFVILSFSCLVLVFTAAASVHSTYEAHTAKVLSLKETLSGTRGRWKRALKTSIWMILIGAASAALWFFMFGMVGIMAEGSAVNYLALLVIILGCIYALRLYVIWMVSLVVSVIEDDVSGLKAITQAGELMKGKRRQGYKLMVLLILAGGAISLVFGFLQGKVPVTQNAQLGSMVAGLVIDAPKTLALCVLKLFTFAVYTVFYHECKVRKTEEENRALYTPIPEF